MSHHVQNKTKSIAFSDSLVSWGSDSVRPYGFLLPQINVQVVILLTMTQKLHTYRKGR